MTLPINSSNSKGGFALVLVLTVLAVLILLICAIIPYSLVTYRRLAFQRDLQSALYLAEAGINEKLFALNQEPPDTEGIPLTEPFGPGKGSFTVEYSLGPPDKIVSTGRVSGRERKIEIEVRQIAEAFNKHIIYGKEVNLQNALTKGNVCYDNGGIDTISPTGSNYTITPLSPLDTSVEIPSPDLSAYQATSHHVYSDGDCINHPGQHPPASYNHNDDSYLFNSLPAGIIYIVDVVDDDFALGGDNDKPSAFLNSIGLNGSLIIEGNLTLSGSSVIQATNPDEPAIIAANILINPGNHQLKGLIFGSGSVTIRGGTIKGAVVSEQIDISGAALEYDPESFKAGNNPVYKHFSGGKRSFIPAPGSWKEN